MIYVDCYYPFAFPNAFDMLGSHVNVPEAAIRTGRSFIEHH